MRRGPASGTIVGRDEELAAIDRFLGDRKARALVLEGEAGIGKTTLWREGVERARERGQEVLTARPASVEAALSLAALADLLAAAPHAARDELPEPQRHALAFALAEEGAGSPSVEGALGVAVLGLLRAVAANRPVLLAIDDLQWLDEGTAAVLVYALRRLDRDEIRLLASGRMEPGSPLPFGLERALDERVLERLVLRPLSAGATRQLVRLQLGLRLTRPQMHVLHETSRGNPFYALELARDGLEMDDFGALRLAPSIQQLAGRRLRALPARTRDALLFVAALANPTMPLVERIGVRADLEPALDEGVLQLEHGSLQFAHPLVAAAAWAAADERRLRDVHRELAGAVDDLEERARHLAVIAESPDPDTADVLEQAAARALLRGAPATAADLLERARELSPPGDDERWARLTATAAAAHAAAGHADSVADLVAQAQERLPAGLERARILVTAAEMRPGLEELFTQAIEEAGGTRVGVRARLGLAQQLVLTARWDESVELGQEAVQLARRLRDRALVGASLSYLGCFKVRDSRPDAAQDLAEAWAIERELGGLPTSVFWSPRTWHGCLLLCKDDLEGAGSLLEQQLALAGELGDDLSALQTEIFLVVVDLRAGSWTSARARAGHALDLAETQGHDYGRAVASSLLASIDAQEGELDRAREGASAALELLDAFGDRLWSTQAHRALLVAELSARNAPDALVHVDAISNRLAGASESWWSHHQGDELAALVLAGEHERSLARAAAIRRAGARLRLPRFLVWADRAEGLVHAAKNDLAAAERALAAALDGHRAYDLPFERARTLLAYGHVLRRLLHRRAAREALTEAVATFDRLGARLFAETARGELQHVGGREPVGEHELTRAEAQVARLVASGLSNKEVAAELAIAVSTVEATLTRIYRKLGLISRSQLVLAFAGRELTD